MFPDSSVFSTIFETTLFRTRVKDLSEDLGAVRASFTMQSIPAITTKSSCAAMTLSMNRPLVVHFLKSNWPFPRTAWCCRLLAMLESPNSKNLAISKEKYGLFVSKNFPIYKTCLENVFVFYGARLVHGPADIISAYIVHTARASSSACLLLRMRERKRGRELYLN